MKTSPEHINLFGKFVVVLSRLKLFFAQRASEITAVNSFHPVLKYTWEISDTSLVFSDIKISIEGNGLCTSIYHKPTDSQLLVVFIFAAIARQEFHTFFTVSQTSSITPGDDSDFSKKVGAMCQFFDKRGCPFSVVQAGYHRAQQIHRKSATKTAEKENTDRISFTLIFHLHNWSQIYYS